MTDLLVQPIPNLGTTKATCSGVVSGAPCPQRVLVLINGKPYCPACALGLGVRLVC